MSNPLKQFDFWRRKMRQDVRDKIKGPYYEMEGQRFLVPVDAPPGARRALARGTYEAPERALIRAHLPRELPVIELGGSYGIVSHVVRKHLQSDVLQVVVEANPALIPVCAHNLASAGATEQTRLVNAALGYGPNGRVKFVALPGHHTSYVTEEDVPGALDLPALSLEALAEQYIGEGPFSVVCDIEGAELMLLRNDEAALKRCKALIVELHPEPFEAMGSSLAEVEAMVESLGFEIVERQEQTVAAVKPEGA